MNVHLGKSFKDRYKFNKNVQVHHYIDFWGFSQIFPDFQSSTDCGHIFNPQLCIDLTQQNANQYIHFILQELKPVPGFFCWGRGVLAHFY
jgi:hypothetical protein